LSRGWKTFEKCGCAPYRIGDRDVVIDDVTVVEIGGIALAVGVVEGVIFEGYLSSSLEALC